MGGYNFGVKMKPYLKLCTEFSSSAFTLSDVRRVLRATPASAKVIVSRLKSTGRLLQLGRGKYRLVRPENFFRLQKLRTKNPKLHRLALEIYRKYPDLKMLVLYGSQVRGDIDRFSDYDILLVLETLPNSEEKNMFVRELEQKLGIRLHLIVCSVESYRMFLVIEPHSKFWLNEAIILDEADLFGALPPTAKLGYFETLRTAENYLEMAGKGKGSPREASYCLIALKIVLMLNHAIELDYDFENVKKEIEKLVDGDLLSAVRMDPVSPRRINRRHVEGLMETTKEKLEEVRRKLGQLGQNESDLFWRSKVGASV